MIWIRFQLKSRPKSIQLPKLRSSTNEVMQIWKFSDPFYPLGHIRLPIKKLSQLRELPLPHLYSWKDHGAAPGSGKGHLPLFKLKIYSLGIFLLALGDFYNIFGTSWGLCPLEKSQICLPPLWKNLCGYPWNSPFSFSMPII